MLRASGQLYEVPSLGRKQAEHKMSPDNKKERRTVEVITAISFHTMQKFE
jgi:hypothetical protein